MSRLYFPVLALIAIWLGGRLPLGDPGYLDLARGRTLGSTFQWASAAKTAKAAAAEGEPGWLGSLLLYQAHRAAGEPGVRALSGLVVAGGATLLYRTSPGGAAFLLSLAALVTLHGTSEISVDLFGWPLFAACVLCLRGLPPPGLRRLAFVPPLLAFWPHFAPGVILGLGLLGLTVAAGLARRFSRKATPSGVSLWKLSLVAALAVTLLAINPGGLTTVDNPLLKAALLGKAEAALWRPIRMEEDAAFLLLAALVGALAGFSVDVSLAEALALVALVCLTGFSRHFAPFFVAAGVPLAALSLAGLAKRLSASARRFAGAGPALLLSAGLGFSLLPALTPPPPHPFSGALAELERTLPRGPLFHVPEVGGLIAWTQPGGLAPTADLRPRSLGAFEARMKEGLSRLLEGVGVALVSRRFARAHEGAIRGLAPDLAATYFDDHALLYVDRRRSPRLAEEKALRHFDPLLPIEAYAEDRIPAVRRELARFLETHPPFATGLVSLGGLVRRTGDREQALEIFEAARRIAPDDPAILTALSALYLEKGMYRLAEEATRASLRSREDDQSFHRLGHALAGQGRLAEAARSFEKEIARHGESIEARRALGEIYERLGRAAEAERERERAQGLERVAVAAAKAEAEACASKLDFAGAARAYQNALKVRPDDREILWQLALTLLTDERPLEAGQTLSQLLRVEPQHAEAHLVRGALCARSVPCRPGEAGALLERFLELAPRDLNAELARAEIARLERNQSPRVK